MGSTSEIRVLPWESEADGYGAFVCAAQAFGTQVADSLWRAMVPGWDTPEGRKKYGDKLGQQWKDNNNTKDKNGVPHAVLLKAVVTDDDGAERIIGYSVWTQYSAVEGHGAPLPSREKHLAAARDKYPDDEKEQRFVCAALAGLSRQRVAAIRDKVHDEQTAVFALDICAVDPAFQGRGAAKKMVEYGVAEAKRRGDLELMTEGSAMGRHVYVKYGFQPQGPDMDFGMPEEFKDRPMPPNVFMRTKPKQ